MWNRLNTKWLGVSKGKMKPLVYVHKIVVWFSELSLPVKLVTGGLAAVLTGSGYLGFLSEYATYWYSFQSNIRLPLEGIPYLRVAVTTSAFLISLLASVVFIIIYIFGYLVLNLITFFDRQMPVENGVRFLEKYRSLPSRKFYILATISVVFVSVIVFAIVQFSELIQGESAYSNFIVLGMPVMAATQYALMRNPKSLRWISSIFSLVIVVGAPVYIFNFDQQGEILKTLGYGGGIPMEIEYRKDVGGLNSRIAGRLILRTSSAIFLKGNDSADVVELQLSAIKSIKYIDEVRFAAK